MGRIKNMAKRKVFIGSSTEALNVARALQGELHRQNPSLAVTVWDQSIVNPSQYFLPELVKEIKDSQFAIFVFHSDDVAVVRGKTRLIPRDNVTFECGLACGILGKDNVFLFKEQKCKILSDYIGVQYTEYDKEDFESNYRTYTGPAVTSIINSIMNNKELNLLRWDGFVNSVERLGKKLKKSPRQGGYHYSCILGISRGGIIVADMINRYLNCPGPLFCINQSFHASDVNANFDIPANQGIFSLLSQAEYDNILIVDDISRTGTTVVTFTNFIKEKFPNKTINNAVLYIPKKYSDKVNYYGTIIDQSAEEQMPYSVLD